ARMVASLDNEKYGSRNEPGTRLPATVAPRTPIPPMIEASATLPLRILYIHRPTNSAMGIVQAMVKVPQELPGMSWTVFSGTTNREPSFVLASATGRPLARSDWRAFSGG